MLPAQSHFGVKLLHRYIFSSVATAAASGVLMFAFVLVTANAMKDILERLASGQIGLDMAARLLLLLVPFTMSYAAPMGILVGILVVLGRLSSRSEVVAMKSAGISIWRISAPILLIAMMGTGVCFYVNNYFGPQCRTEYKSLLAGTIRNEPLSFIVPGRFIRDFPGYVFYVGERDGERLGNVWLWVLGPDKELRQFIQAREGCISFDEAENALVLSVEKATGQFRSDAVAGDLSQVAIEGELARTSFAMSLDKLLPEGNGKARPKKIADMSLPQLLEARAEALSEVEQAGEGTKLKEQARNLFAKYSYHVNRNFAFAYSVIALAMLGIPLGIKVGRQETYANMAVALALSMLYFFMMIMVGWADRVASAYPQVLVWIPNLLFQTLGLFLMHRANRH